MGAVDTTYTFTATDTITSAKMNNIIDQTTMTSDAIVGTTLEVASGKLKVRSAGITSNELAANVVGTGPVFRAFNSTATSIIANVPTKVTLGSKSFDTNNNFDTTLSRFLPTVAGYYQINCSVYIFAAPAGLRAEIRKNGNLVASGSEPLDRNTSSNISDVVYCNGSSDYIEMFAYIPGSTASTLNDSARTFMSGCLIRSA